MLLLNHSSDLWSFLYFNIKVLIPKKKIVYSTWFFQSFFFAPMDSLLSPDWLITHPGLARLLCLPVSYTHTALCTRISRWLLSSHIRSIILPSKNHLYLVSLFTGCLAFPRSQLCHSDQSSVNGKQPLYTRAEHTTAALSRSRNACILFNVLWASTCCWTGPP